MKNENKKEQKKGISFLLDILKGISLGISAAVPGLSAGTIAVVEKCYDPIVDAVSELKKSFKKSFLYLLPYVIGLLLGALAALVGIKKGYEAAPFTLTGFFAGFIVGSLPVTFSELKKGENLREKLFHALSFLLLLLFAAGIGIFTALYKVDLSQAMNDRVWWMYLLVPIGGLLAAGACVVPGISGSMVMMVLGLYYPVLGTYIGDTSIFHSDSTSFKVTGIVYGLLLVVSAVIGVILASKMMRHFLTKHRVTTFYGIAGLIIGSLISMFINSSIYPLYPTIQSWDYLVGAILFVLCAGLTFFLFFYQNHKKKQETPVSEEQK